MSEFKGQALNYNVIVKNVVVENVTESGLTIQSEVDKNEKWKQGEIISIGNLCPKKDVTILGIKIPYWKVNSINIGQQVIYDKYKATDVTIDGEKYQTIYYSDLLSVL